MNVGGSSPSANTHFYDGTVSPPLKTSRQGVACTKTGEESLQDFCGGSDSHLLHLIQGNLQQVTYIVKTSN